MKLTEEAGPGYLPEKHRLATVMDRESQLKASRTSPPTQQKELDLVHSGGNGCGAIFGDQESGDIL